MKLLITGGRHLTDEHYPALRDWLNYHKHRYSEIWHGNAKGADQLAARWCAENNYPVRTIEPNYELHPGRYAPLMRNKQLVDETDETLALHTGEMSNGTAHTAGLSVSARHTTVKLNVITRRSQILY